MPFDVTPWATRSLFGVASVTVCVAGVQRPSATPAAAGTLTVTVPRAGAKTRYTSRGSSTVASRPVSVVDGFALVVSGGMPLSKLLPGAT